MDENRYCVYLHRRADNGDVYYVGSGVKGKRERHFSNRSVEWHLINNLYGTSVEIYKDNLTLNEARNLEKELILSDKYPSIINKRLPVKSVDMDINKLMRFVKYDESSSTFLVWINKTGPRSEIGKPAGNLSFNCKLPKSSHVMIQGVSYSIPRLIWEMFNGKIPSGYIIDHIDGNPHNNNIQNLRCTTIASNNKNRVSVSTEKELPSGIYFSESKNAIIASAVYHAERKTKTFSLNRHEYSEAVTKAVSWRICKLEEFGVLDDYSDRHLGINPNDYLGCDFSTNTICSSGFDNIWIKYKDGVPISVSGGLYKTGRRYVSINDKISYDIALKICLDHIEKQKTAANAA